MTRRRLPVGVVSAATLLGLLLAAALVPGWLSGASPTLIVPAAALETHSWTHPLGTDALGRDVLARLVDGTAETLAAPLVLALVAVGLALAPATLAGYRGGRVDAIVGRIVDIAYSIPAFVVAIVVLGVAGGSIWTAVVVLALLHVPDDVRVLRAAVAEQRPLAYVEAAEVLGVPARRIVLLHLLAPIRTLVISLLLLRFTYGLVEIAGLAYLGLGTEPGSTAWGRMVDENAGDMLLNVWAAAAPAIALVVAAICVHVLADWATGGRTRR